MRTARLFRVIVAAMLVLPASVSAQQPPDTQGLIQERDSKTEQLRQDDKGRAQRELLERQQDERAARQRLDSGRIERMQAPTLMQGAPPNLSGGAVQPGFADRAGAQMNEEAARRDRLNYDSAVRARDDAARGAGDATGRAAPWKPIGAR